MNWRIYISVGVCVLAITACKEKNSFKKGKDGGMQYQFFKLGEGAEVQEGNILKMETIQKYNDSVLHDTRKEGPQYLRFDSTILSKESYAIMGKVSVGDSLVFKVDADSAFKGKKPPFVRKKGGYLYTYMKVLNIFRTEDEYKAAVDPEGYRREQQQKQQQNGFGQDNGGWGGQGQRGNQPSFEQMQRIREMQMQQQQGMGNMGNQQFSLPEQGEGQNFEQMQQQRPAIDHP